MFFAFSITNLKYWGHSEQIMRKSLNLLNDLTLTFSLIRRLIKLEEIQFMLSNHTVRVVVDYLIFMDFINIFLHFRANIFHF
jgi:hypothetical protein